MLLCATDIMLNLLSPAFCRLAVAIGITARFVVRHDLAEEEAVQVRKSNVEVSSWENH